MIHSITNPYKKKVITILNRMSNIVKYTSLDWDNLDFSDLKRVGKNKTTKRVSLSLNGDDVYIQGPRMKAPFGPNCFTDKDGNEGSWSLECTLPKDHFLYQKLQELEQLVLQNAEKNSQHHSHQPIQWDNHMDRVMPFP